MSQNLPPVFSDMDKFDGSNWVAWSGLIGIAADLRGISGYLEGSIPKPPDIPPITVTAPMTTPTSTPPTSVTPLTTTSTTTTTTVAADTPWDSLTPSTAEWKMHNAWAKGLLVYNTKDPIGLGIVMSGSAADTWKSYKDQYAKVSEVALMNAERDLHETLYSDSQNFLEHIARLHMLWAMSTALGSKINNKSFRTVVLSSLPHSWDPIVSTLYNTTTSREAITVLNTHWARVSKDCVVNPQNTTTTLQFSANNRGCYPLKTNILFAQILTANREVI